MQRLDAIVRTCTAISELRDELSIVGGQSDSMLLLESIDGTAINHIVETIAMSPRTCSLGTKNLEFAIQ